MAKIYACIKKAFIQGRLWEPSSKKKLVLGVNDKLPKGCFVEVKLNIPVVEKKEDPVTLASIQNEANKAEDETLLVNMTRDDLIAEVVNRGLSKDLDVTKLNKKEMIELIIESPAMATIPVEEPQEDETPEFLN